MGCSYPRLLRVAQFSLLFHQPISRGLVKGNIVFTLNCSYYPFFVTIKWTANIAVHCDIGRLFVQLLILYCKKKLLDRWATRTLKLCQIDCRHFCNICINLVLRVSLLPAPWSERGVGRRETLRTRLRIHSPNVSLLTCFPSSTIEQRPWTMGHDHDSISF